MRFLASSIERMGCQTVVLAPARPRVSTAFRRICSDDSLHEALIASMQRMRGGAYVQDGAISPSELTDDGRHRQRVDTDSWHLLALNRSGIVCGCARMCLHEDAVSFADLGVRNVPLARSPEWSVRLRRAVESELAEARRKRLWYAEVGGWAINSDRRCTVDALGTVLAVYALAELLGGALMIGTATRRHNSAPILRRIGARPLVFDEVEIPPYYDPAYGCEMEILRFDSANPRPAYMSWLAEIRERMADVPVICPSRTVSHTVPEGFSVATSGSRLRSPVPAPAAGLSMRQASAG